MLILVEILALIVASNTHSSYLHRSSISLDEFGFLAKKIVTKSKSGHKDYPRIQNTGFLMACSYSNLGQSITNKSSKDQ